MVEFMKATTNGHSAADLGETIPPVEEARAVPRPDTVDKLWIEHEADKKAEQQRKLHEESGETEAAAADKIAAELGHQADRAEEASDRRSGLAAVGSDSYSTALKVLGRHDQRRRDAVFVYWLRWILFMLGDIAGAGGAILLLGEEPFNAIAQATSVAVSAVTLGGVGRQFRYWVAAKERQKPIEALSEEESQYASWFDGPDSVGTGLKVLALLCMTGIAAVVGGIFALRAAAEGQEAALAFGCFALGLGLASAYNSYDVADQVAEHLETVGARAGKLETEARKVRAEPVIAQRAGARKEADSKRQIGAAAGEAAALEQYNHMYRVIHANPQVAGHGTAAPKPPARSDDAEGGPAAKEEDRP